MAKPGSELAAMEQNVAKKMTPDPWKQAGKTVRRGTRKMGRATDRVVNTVGAPKNVWEAASRKADKAFPKAGR